ncbi:MAG: acetyl-CoA carboxylase carboxyl transferase subunit alpha [Hyphomicrobiales bacterium]|nr:acetyl-CoA carboxylase carboxyltransferase subunit alpha [Hyphomicrobiales bacterium]PCH49710.1 MAG: acetyl-CoA carboxylase carboxyl transferase subunit alpha [Hyphomicrobiales bacterium]
MRLYLDFEKPVADIEGRIHELKTADHGEDGVDLSSEIKKLEAKSEATLENLYQKLTPWHKTHIARHPDRPHFVDYRKQLFTDFMPLAGDRYFAEDFALIAGFARFDGEPVAIIGQEKGNDTQSRLKHNFGMVRPEGYRKAVRIMELANRYKIPVVTLVDTAGAYPGIGAEERGQAEAIARSTEMGLNLEVPVVTVVIGEGGSGGAIAIATGNRVYMLEHSIYSVISPEAGASILWRDAGRAQDVANSMKITAQDLMKMGVIDGIIDEPTGGAHRDPQEMIRSTGGIIRQALAELGKMSGKELKEARRDKFLAIGRNLS